VPGLGRQRLSVRPAASQPGPRGGVIAEQLPRRMYLRTCFSERWRVWSMNMMERSVAPPSAAAVASPERSECPENTLGVEPSGTSQPFDNFRELVIGNPSPRHFSAPAPDPGEQITAGDVRALEPVSSAVTGQLSGCDPYGTPMAWPSPSGSVLERGMVITTPSSVNLKTAVRRSLRPVGQCFQ
jgi:hypothetical protein